MISVTISTEFSAAKRLSEFKGNCANLHGYQHKIEVTLSGNYKNDMVIDFYEAQAKLKNWIDNNWDHNLLLNEKDRKLGDFIENYTGQSIYYFNSEPTAEKMAEYLFQKVLPEILPQVKCVKVRLYDNAQAFVEVS